MKILKNDNQSSVSIRIKEGQGVLLLEDDKGESYCLYIESLNDDFKKILDFTNLKKYKFIGYQSTLDKITMSKTLDHINLERKVIESKPFNIFYDPMTKKIRIPKQEDSTEKIPLFKKKKRVLVIDDSKTIQTLLRRIIEKSNLLEVYAIANCPSEAKTIIEKDRPDLITLDIHMPEMTGVEFLKTYLKKLHIPVVMISSVSMNEGPLIMEALTNGALSYIEKPSLDKLSSLAPIILSKLEEIATAVPVERLTNRHSTVLKFDDLDGLIAIGSSTGGTQALEVIFTSLPKEIPPIVVVQHIPAVFSKALAERLNTLCPFTIKEAENDEVLEKNTIYIAPGGNQFKLVQFGNIRRIEINDDPPLMRFRPSVDYLFNSIANFNIKKLIGVILTGMGKDGAQGLLKIKENGAYTIAQDENSSVVFGMPKEAIRIGAAEHISALENVTDDIIIAYNKINIKNAA